MPVKKGEIILLNYGVKIKKLVVLIAVLLTINCFATRIWTCPAPSSTILKQLAQGKTLTKKNWVYSLKGTVSQVKVQAMKARFTQARMGDSTGKR